MEMCSEIHRHLQLTPWSAENLLCISGLHTDISNIFVIRRKRRYSSPHTTWWRNGRASWRSPCL